MEVCRYATIAALTTLNFLLGELWMSYTKYTYLRLHIFLLAPITFLIFVPPNPLGKLPPKVRYTFLVSMLLLSIVSVVFSVLTFEYDFWGTGAIYLMNDALKESYGEIMHCPVEEIAWCIDHTLLVAFFVLSIWRVRPVRKTQGNAQIGLRCSVTVAFLAIAYAGYTMKQLQWGDKYYYLGVELFWSFLLFAYIAVYCAHMFLPYAMEYLLGILVPGAYTAFIDAWAAHRGVWGTSDQFILGIRYHGLIFEQALAYFFGSALAVVGAVAALRVTETYLAVRSVVKGSPVKVFALALIWGED